VMLKLGTYGFIRFAIPLFPGAALEAAPIFIALAVIGIIYGALLAMVQPDLKRLVAYSSVSHLGFVMLGIFALDPQGLQGAIYQMLNHGLSTGALFLLVGMIYLRRHSRAIADFGGLWKSVPMWAAVFMFVMLSSIGLPGLNGFVGEFLILLGAFLRVKIAVYFAVTGIILSALYMMWAYERVMWGPLTAAVNRTLADLNGREIAVMAPLMGLMLLLGIYPRPILSRMEPSVAQLLARVQTARDVADAARAPDRRHLAISESPIRRPDFQGSQVAANAAIAQHRLPMAQ
jgi:NADH-quinone oxidoreductase subunit M